VTIKRAGYDAAAQIARIHARSWFAGFSPVFGQAIAARAVASRCNVQIWQDRLARNAIVLVAEQGFVQHTDTEIERLYVEPEAWGSGLAHALMTQALSEMSEHAFVWSAQTDQARRFYSKCGFTPTGSVRTAELLDGVMATDIELQRNNAAPWPFIANSARAPLV
jgi:GNAT superfamily N-acetyltransferase